MEAKIGVGFTDDGWWAYENDRAPLEKVGLRPSLVRGLVGPRPGERLVVQMPKAELLVPSRTLLLRAYDSCFPSQGWRQWQESAAGRALQPAHWSERPEPCSLELVWPDEKLSKEIRMACVVDIYRSLSGDVTTAEEALAGEASLIARKRDQANNTPSAPFRRWMAEPPLNKLSAGRMGYASSGYVSEALYDNRSSFHCTLRGDYGGGGSPMRALKSTRAPIPSADVLVRPITPTRSISTPKRRGHGGRSVSPRTKWDPHGTLYTSPGPGDYEQREKTLSQRIFDQSATPLGIHGRPIRKSASFASGTARPSGLFSGHKTDKGPRTGAHEALRKHNYFYDPSGYGHRAKLATSELVDESRVDDIFGRFHGGSGHQEGSLKYEDLWGALHHYGVDLASPFAHRVVHSYLRRPAGRMDRVEFGDLVRLLEAPEEERKRREAVHAAAIEEASQRAQERAEARERGRREQEAESSRQVAIEKSKVMAETARQHRCNYEEHLLSEQSAAEEKAAEKAKLHEAEQLELQWRRRAQAEADVAQSWREQQTHVDWIRKESDTRREAAMYAAWRQHEPPRRGAGTAAQVPLPQTAPPPHIYAARIEHGMPMPADLLELRHQQVGGPVTPAADWWAETLNDRVGAVQAESLSSPPSGPSLPVQRMPLSNPSLGSGLVGSKLMAAEAAAAAAAAELARVRNELVFRELE